MTDLMSRAAVTDFGRVAPNSFGRTVFDVCLPEPVQDPLGYLRREVLPAERRRVNRDLLLCALDRIQADPAGWAQAQWLTARTFESCAGLVVCRTAMCLAGHVAVLAGADMPPFPVAHGSLAWLDPCDMGPGGDWMVSPRTGESRVLTEAELSARPRGELWPVATYAAHALHISHPTARVLFAWDNTLARLVTLAEALCAA